MKERIIIDGKLYEIEMNNKNVKVNKYQYLLVHHDIEELDMKEFLLIQELVERATPKKVNHNPNKILLTICPKCNADIMIHFEYCPICGQALEWE